jgi:S1-C subfamily serine protease
VGALAVAGAVIAMVGAVGLGLGGATTGGSSVLSANAPLLSVPQAPSAATGAGVNVQGIAAAVDPTVVDINTVFQSAGGSGQAAGTGIILTSSGEVLTNKHVVEGATSITVTIAGQSGSYTAQVLGVDPTADVALIQVEGVSGLPMATLADSSTLAIGEPVVAIGNAGGVGGTPSVSQGAIVALNQAITASSGTSSEHLTGLIQSNAMIAPGDSGGPLVNAAGQVIGMTTAGQSSRQSTSTTVGFAIPSNAALAIVNQIRAGQASPQVILGQVGYLGISVTDLTPQIASRLGLQQTSGALVVGVISGSPAQAAGLGRYSVVTDVAGSPIAAAADLGTALHSHKPGDQVQITWVSQAGTTQTATVTLTTGPAI